MEPEKKSKADEKISGLTIFLKSGQRVELSWAGNPNFGNMLQGFKRYVTTGKNEVGEIYTGGNNDNRLFVAWSEVEGLLVM